MVTTLTGKYGTAKIFTDKVEQTAKSQIIEIMNQEFVFGSNVAIMPDVHAGKGCVIGFTAKLTGKIVPNIVGVDIGCGMFVIKLGKMKSLDLYKLDEIIKKHVPSGSNVHNQALVSFSQLNKIYCMGNLRDGGKFNRSIGTLGGGNHFIELDKDNDDNYYLVIHTGSRNLGKQVAEHYQDVAIEECTVNGNLKKQREQMIDELKSRGRSDLIQESLKKLEENFKNSHPSYPRDLCFLSEKNDSYHQYLMDMVKCQSYASLNREVIANTILKKWLGTSYFDYPEFFHTVHNYIDFGDNTIRKGAVRASYGEKLIIPINMKEGSIIATGLGNDECNKSAPHGAGRLHGRGEAKRIFSMEEYESEMEGIFSTSVSLSTIDESPMAYKPIDEILSNIGDMVEVEKIIRPVYNYKNGDDKS